jgi:Formyl transferase
MIGRKRNVLSVCQFPFLPPQFFLPHLSPRVLLSLAPLKRLGQKLNLPVTSIPHVRSELKTWKVTSILHLSKTFANYVQPPSPFYPLAGPPSSNHLLLTASFGRILPSSLLALFKQTHTLNVHPSALPAYRGPAPIQRAILNGERDTAVCVIEMKRRGGIDAGDVLGRLPVVRYHPSIHFPVLKRLARPPSLSLDHPTRHRL